MDAAANFCYGTVSTAPSPAASGTSMVVTLLGGATLPATPWNAFVWITGQGPLASNAEIVRVTNVSMSGAAATLTIVRAQESTSARTIVVGDQFAVGPTAKFVTDLIAELAALSPTLNDTGAGETLIADDATAQLKKLIAGANVTLTPSADGVEVSVSAPGTGDVVGPASSVDSRPALFDGTTGKLLKQASAALGTAAFAATGDFDAAGAAAAAQAAAVQRANHTGSQAISTVTNLQTELDGKVDENSAITPATKTKITFDAKGLVTAGADATTADIADSSNKRYVTDAQLTVIGNTSGTNTGDLAIVSQAEAEAGVATTGRTWTAERVAQAIAALETGGGGGGGDMLSTLTAAEISITTTATATISRMHVCSGTASNYTVTLPAASGNDGKFIGIRMAPGLTKLITIDGNGSETIDGVASIYGLANDAFILKCDGSNWAVIDYKRAPQTGQAVLSGDFTLNSTGNFQDTGLTVTLPKPGTYLVTGNIRVTMVMTSGVGYISVKLNNVTAGADVADSTRLVFLSIGTTNNQLHAGYTWLVTVTVATVLNLYAGRFDGGSANFNNSLVTSDANGRTVLLYSLQ